MMRRCLFLACFSLFIISGMVSLSDAANVAGVVKDAAGKPLPGVMVTADDAARKLAKTVVSDDGGKFLIPGLSPGKYAIRAQRIGYETGEIKDFALSKTDAGGLSFSLKEQKDISEQMPPSAWLSLIPEGDMKLAFMKGCTICHQVGDKATRLKDKAGWIEAIKKMRKIDEAFNVIPKVDDGALADMLAKVFGLESETPKFQAPPPLTGESARVVITEYKMPDVGFAHDLAVGLDGYIWIVDFLGDKLIKLNPMNGKRKDFELPVKGAGAHTIHADRTGKLWMTWSFADMIASFDPVTEKMRIYGGLSKGSYPHSHAFDTEGYIAFDKGGHLWVTQLRANKLTRLHPETGKVTEYDTPLKSEKPQYAGIYGISMAPDGNVWYGKYGEDTFGMINTETGEIAQFEMPKKVATHRLSVDDKGFVWIAESATGRLSRYDPATKTFKYYDLPDKDTSPYSARVDGPRGVVWVTGNLADAIYKFDMATEKFVKYQLPSKQAFARMVAVDQKTGELWTSYSNFPGPAVVARLKFLK